MQPPYTTYTQTMQLLHGNHARIRLFGYDKDLAEPIMYKIADWVESSDPHHPIGWSIPSFLFEAKRHGLLTEDAAFSRDNLSAWYGHYVE